ncbi:hypothetical protein KSS87_001736 [Heliosperma pusillum]|nr:hypothetical protein KSS87_001736 [Heliosperma pusillum]
MTNKIFSIILITLIAFAMFANEAMAGGYGQGSLSPNRKSSFACLPYFNLIL